MSAINLKDAREYLNTIDEKDIEVYVVSREDGVINQAVSVPLLDLFTRKHVVYKYEPSAFPSRELIDSSPLRFSWEYRNPRYYKNNQSSAISDYVVVITAGDLATLFPNKISVRLKQYHFDNSFRRDEGIFQYKTFVTVYRRTS